MLIWPKPLIIRKKGKKIKKDKEVVDTTPQKKQEKKPSDPEGTCYSFYGVVGQNKNYCSNYDVWHAKRSMLLNLVSFEINLTSIPRHIL